MNPPCLFWPSLDEAYTDEFGEICPEVYQAAGELWPQAESFMNSKLPDPAAGMRLMFKAAAAVSRKLQEQPNQIRNLKAYLWTSFKHEIFEAAEKENRYQPLEPEQQPTNGAYNQSEALNDHILIEELISHMDSWTRKVFELRVLGYQFEDIGQMLDMSPKLLRSKFHKEVKKLTHKLFG
jgi:DNA-directed RNA polymerase specialized sigma24 family protein